MMYLIIIIYIHVKNCMQKNGIFYIYFSFVHISLNFAPNNLKLSMDVDDI